MQLNPKLPKDAKVLRVWANKGDVSVAFAEVTLPGSELKKVYSAGTHDQGLLGNSSEKNMKFKPLDYDENKIQFEHLSVYDNAAMAID